MNHRIRQLKKSSTSKSRTLFTCSYGNQGDEHLNNLFKQCGTDLLKLSEELETIIQAFPSITGKDLNIFFSNELVKIFCKSKESIKEFNDDYISD